MLQGDFVESHWMIKILETVRDIYLWMHHIPMNRLTNQFYTLVEPSKEGKYSRHILQAKPPQAANSDAMTDTEADWYIPAKSSAF